MRTTDTYSPANARGAACGKQKIATETVWARDGNSPQRRAATGDTDQCCNSSAGLKRGFAQKPKVNNDYQKRGDFESRFR
jgi:hypothetical protein